jgi:hypothetical protein
VIRRPESSKSELSASPNSIRTWNLLVNSQVFETLCLVDARCRECSPFSHGSVGFVGATAEILQDCRGVRRARARARSAERQILPPVRRRRDVRPLGANRRPIPGAVAAALRGDEGRTRLPPKRRHSSLSATSRTSPGTRFVRPEDSRRAR